MTELGRDRLVNILIYLFLTFMLTGLVWTVYGYATAPSRGVVEQMQEEMQLRDKFAVAALKVLAGRVNYEDEYIARRAYQIADQMIIERRQ